jgi:site-specific DNA-methyltransferase (adenine-specific)
MEVMSRYPEKHFDLAIVDPPYGININSNMGLAKGRRKRHKEKSWDKYTPDHEFFDMLKASAKHRIIWGGNYFNLPPTKHVIFWDKLTPIGMSFSDGELAWTSFDRAIRKFTMNNITNDKIHPTQKPVALYKWLLKNYAKEGDLILDTHGGSGSILIACYEMGFDIVWTELDTDYYNAAIERFRKHIAQGSLFAPKDQYGTQSKID